MTDATPQAGEAAAPAKPQPARPEATSDDIEVLRAEVRRLRGELAYERGRNEDLLRRVRSAETNAEVSAAQTRQLRESSSWRVTAPLRAATSALRRL